MTEIMAKERRSLMNGSRVFLAAFIMVFMAFAAGAQTGLTGRVQAGGKGVSGATVTLYAAGAAAPVKLGEATSDGSGAFTLSGGAAPAGSVLYVLAKKGETVAFLCLVGSTLPKSMTVNELTTVASAFTAARFVRGETISGNDLGLRIAAGNVPNLVDPATGSWGKVVLDPINITQSTTLANLNTLGSLLSAYATTTDSSWRSRFLKAASGSASVAPKTSLEAIENIAREP